MRFDQHQITTRLAIFFVFVASASVNRPLPAQQAGGVMLNSGSFRIPFTIADNGSAPAEVQLYVADMDRITFGQDESQAAAQVAWRLLDRQLPDAGEFRVSGTPDGTFWFGIRTVDAFGKPHPDGPMKPQYKVVIDSILPTVELEADADPDGIVNAMVSAQDDSGVKQVTAHYVTDSTRVWKIAPVERSNDQSTGRIRLHPDDEWQQLSLRVRVTDGAGNESVATKLVQRPRIATAPTTRFASGPPWLPGAASLSGSPNAPFTSANVELPPPATGMEITSAFGTAVEELPAPPAETIPTPRPRTPAEAMRPLQRESLPTPAPDAGTIPPQGFVPDHFPTKRTQPETIAPPQGEMDAPASLNQPQSNANTLLNNSDWSPLSPAMKANRPSYASGTSQGVTPPAETIPPGRSTFEGNDRSARGQVIDLKRLAQRSQVRYSNSNRFSLDFELEAVGSRGVEAIELYGSTDGGETWKRWGDDPDKVSPFDIETNTEGVFGFCIVVVGSNGLASPRPLPGDAPDIVVVVDRSAPRASITGAKYGEGDRVGSLVIRYACEDEFLAERPITLAFSATPDGPWTTIAAGLRNVGDHVWPADPQLPRQIYLRIDVADGAGNVGTDILEQPIDTQGLAPRARIRAFRTIGS